MNDSDKTLVFSRGAPTGGTALAIRCAKRLGLPCLGVDLAKPAGLEVVSGWIAVHGIGVLNVVGPRASERPRIEVETAAYLRTLLQATR